MLFRCYYYDYVIAICIDCESTASASARVVATLQQVFAAADLSSTAVRTRLLL